MGGCLSGSDEPEEVEGEVNFNHFKVLRAIGKGAFGKVCIVKKRDTRVLYAMKYMSKTRVIRKQAIDNVLQEAEMLKLINHPFLVNLWFAFQDEEDLFLVVDLLLGGDLSWHLEQEGRLDPIRVKLYMAEIALALQYLRTKSIIHRDVKPANMLLDSQGHIHLTDFNVACYKQSKPITLCTGTKPYMAPEMFNPGRRGYSYAVDWWSLGVSAFELLKGARPFHISSTMQSFLDIYALLRTVQPSMSARWDSHLVDLLSKLMHPDYHKRMSNLDTLRQHTLYDTWDFVDVQNMKIVPTFVPPKDQVNCDPTHELEEIILEPNPLHKKSQRLTKGSKSTQSQTSTSESELTELTRLQSSFVIYNRLEDEERVAREKELHRKISSGGTVGEHIMLESELSTINDGDEVSKEDKAVGTPTTEQPSLAPKEADGEKVGNPVPEAAGEDRTESKESGASDAASTPSVVKAEVEVDEATTVRQSDAQGEAEGAKGSNHTAEDIHLQQEDSIPQPEVTAHEEDTVAAPNPTELTEEPRDQVAVSKEPEVDGAAAETTKPPEEPSSSTAVAAETKQPPDGGGEVTAEQDNGQPCSSAEPLLRSPSDDSQLPLVSPSSDSQADSRLPSLVSPSGDSQTESASYADTSLTEKLLGSV